MKNIHIGKEIERRLAYLRMTKTEFAKRIGMLQQNINRVIDSRSIDTDKLQKISDALGFNFFTLYTDNGDKSITIGDKAKAETNDKEDEKVIRERLRNLEMVLAEKERMIQYMLQDGRHDTQK